MPTNEATDTTPSTAGATSSHQWYINIESWTPHPDEWKSILNLLPVEEQKEVMRFHFQKDQKFALCSRLFQRKVVVDAFHVPFESVAITRNDHGKPSWTACPVPTWNYNVSHHGAICAIASQGDRRIGIDVVRVDMPRESVAEFFSCFELQFGPREWVYIRAAVAPADQVERFYLLWSLKEAYTKAIGVGIVIDLQRQQFEIVDGVVSLFVDDQKADAWHFVITRLDASHYVTIAAEGGMMPVSWTRLQAADLAPKRE
ncbi:Aste57867_22844 [Aphanomyces stellatus]|uniref:holo-[acyl-carrier-protein] synthase n=1 Tax=Aphanomyces stellatus TaxID=120398 RepID=A0A485LL16_9STRA|nr:hypothetical protein As57867_022773 [Aphanomyces stellatus]VFT99495.1 Aste57867_22844 [Aphanomyces stellatus]